MLFFYCRTNSNLHDATVHVPMSRITAAITLTGTTFHKLIFKRGVVFCSYFLKPRKQLMEQLDAVQTDGESEMKQLQEQSKLRELLQHSPALVRSLQGA